MKPGEKDETPAQRRSRSLSGTWPASFRPRGTLDPPASFRCPSGPWQKDWRQMGTFIHDRFQSGPIFLFFKQELQVTRNKANLIYLFIYWNGHQASFRFRSECRTGEGDLDLERRMTLEAFQPCRTTCHAPELWSSSLPTAFWFRLRWRILQKKKKKNGADVMATVLGLTLHWARIREKKSSPIWLTKKMPSLILKEKSSDSYY